MTELIQSKREIFKHLSMGIILFITGAYIGSRWFTISGITAGFAMWALALAQFANTLISTRDYLYKKRVGEIEDDLYHSSRDPETEKLRQLVALARENIETLKTIRALPIEKIHYLSLLAPGLLEFQSTGLEDWGGYNYLDAFTVLDMCEIKYGQALLPSQNGLPDNVLRKKIGLVVSDLVALKLARRDKQNERAILLVSKEEALEELEKCKLGDDNGKK